MKPWNVYYYYPSHLSANKRNICVLSTVTCYHVWSYNSQVKTTPTIKSRGQLPFCCRNLEWVLACAVTVPPAPSSPTPSACKCVGLGQARGGNSEGTWRFHKQLTKIYISVGGITHYKLYLELAHLQHRFTFILSMFAVSGNLLVLLAIQADNPQIYQPWRSTSTAKICRFISTGGVALNFPEDKDKLNTGQYIYFLLYCS